MQTFPSFNAYSLEEMTFIGGSHKEIVFMFYDSSGKLIDMTGQIAYWELCPYENPAYVSLSKYGQCGNGYVTITLDSDDTTLLRGKYIQRPSILCPYGSYDFRIGLGIVNIITAVGVSYA